MVDRFNVRQYVEKSWCPDESRFMRADVQEVYRAAFQYLVKREKTVSGRAAPEAFRAALVGFLSLFTKKTKEPLADADVAAVFSGPLEKLCEREIGSAPDKSELHLSRRLIAFVTSHPGYLTKKELREFGGACVAFFKTMFEDVKNAGAGT